MFKILLHGLGKDRWDKMNLKIKNDSGVHLESSVSAAPYISFMPFLCWNGFIDSIKRSLRPFFTFFSNGPPDIKRALE